jgi:hypothetical protein
VNTRIAAAALILTAALEGCADPVLERYADACGRPYAWRGAAPDPEPWQTFYLVLSPEAKAGDLEAARAACANWDEVSSGMVHCEAHLDTDERPDSGGIPVHRCSEVPFWGGTAATFESLIVLRADAPAAPRRIFEHEIGHLLRAHHDIDGTTMCPSTTCMSLKPTPRDVYNVRVSHGLEEWGHDPPPGEPVKLAPPSSPITGSDPRVATTPAGHVQNAQDGSF